MRFSGGLAGIAAAVLVIGVAAIPAARAADSAAGSAATAATPAATLYVNDGGACSDSGPGTLADPYCTIQAAANVVDPGQTVDIAPAGSAEERQSVTITRSGTPTEPITFTWSAGLTPLLWPLAQTGSAVVTFKDVHDVVLSHLQIQPTGSDDGIDVIGSSDISLANLYIVRVGTTGPPGSAGISIDGTSSDVTVSRTYFDGSSGYAVLSSPGARQVTLTTNVVPQTAGSGFTLDGTTGAVVTSNTIVASDNPRTCTTAPTGIALADGSSGTIENNIIDAGTVDSCATPAAGALSVDASSADSAGGVTADYNAVAAGGADDDYSWAGTSYASPAALTVATGQGAHDLSTAPDWINGVPPEGSPVINSADCAAPGELSTDIGGNPWVADPLATDASLGNGSCHASRGAHARQDSLPVTYTAPPIDPSGYTAGVVPYTFGVTVTSTTTSPWDEPVRYTVDFGDGSAPVPAIPGTAATHQYTTPGEYTVTITAADSGGSTAAATDLVYALPVKPLAIGLSAAPGGVDAADFSFSPANLGTDTEEERDGQVISVVFVCGGASTRLPLLAGQGNWQCVYAAPGTYTATLTVTDVLGRTSTAQATATVGDEWPLHLVPTDVYNHEAAAHGLVEATTSGKASAGHSATATAAAGNDGAIRLYNYSSGFKPVTVNVGLAASSYAHP